MATRIDFGMASTLLFNLSQTRLPEDVHLTPPMLADARRINVQNVQDYVKEVDTPGHAQAFTDVYPAAIPFADPLWMEYQGLADAQFGVMVTSHRDDNGEFDVRMDVFAQYSAKRLPVYFGRILYRTDKLGTIQGCVNFDLATWTPVEPHDSLIQETVKSMEGMSRPFFYAMCFANCKNVSQHEVAAPAGLHAMKREDRRRFLCYHTIEIDPMRETLRTEGSVSTNGLLKALHICRGHFKSFDDKPLFGKHRGMYWWPSHVRGSAKSGVVVKDYTIKPM